MFCRVTLGKSFLQFSAMKMAHSPPAHHSVTGTPSVNGLAPVEYVIYRGEQQSLYYIFLFIVFADSSHVKRHYVLSVCPILLNAIFLGTP